MSDPSDTNGDSHHQVANLPEEIYWDGESCAKLIQDAMPGSLELCSLSESKGVPAVDSADFDVSRKKKVNFGARRLTYSVDSGSNKPARSTPSSGEMTADTSIYEQPRYNRHQSLYSSLSRTSTDDDMYERPVDCLQRQKLCEQQSNGIGSRPEKPRREVMDKEDEGKDSPDTNAEENESRLKRTRDVVRRTKRPAPLGKLKKVQSSGVLECNLDASSVPNRPVPPERSKKDESSEMLEYDFDASSVPKRPVPPERSKKDESSKMSEYDFDASSVPKRPVPPERSKKDESSEMLEYDFDASSVPKRPVPPERSKKDESSEMLEYDFDASTVPKRPVPPERSKKDESRKMLEHDFDASSVPKRPVPPERSKKDESSKMLEYDFDASSVPKRPVPPERSKKDESSKMLEYDFDASSVLFEIEQLTVQRSDIKHPSPKLVRPISHPGKRRSILANSRQKAHSTRDDNSYNSLLPSHVECIDEATKPECSDSIVIVPRSKLIVSPPVDFSRGVGEIHSFSTVQSEGGGSKAGLMSAAAPDIGKNLRKMSPMLMRSKFAWSGEEK